MSAAEQEVMQAAADLVDAFARHATEEYFAAFAPEATFCFHTVDVALRSRAEYQRLWRSWEDGGFRVLGCRSSDQHVQMLGSVAIFTHRVSTRVRTLIGEEALDERETIVFVREGNGWLAVHEHLSPVPSGPPDEKPEGC